MWITVLGSHGIYTYFSRVELLFSGNIDMAYKLYFSIDVPIRLSGMVYWMSNKAIESWVIPACIMIGGYILFQYSGITTLFIKIITNINNVYRKHIIK